MIMAGLDLGTVAIKAVLISEEGELMWSKAVPSSLDGSSIAEGLIDDGKKYIGLENNISGIAATGYGRHILPFTDIVVDEISAVSMGAYILSNKKSRTVLNIGGQDSKIVKISDSGRVSDFKMNDKCAAGTGRFIEMAARILDIPLDSIGEFGDPSDLSIIINSTCAIFAESEIVSLLYRKVTKDSIIAGLNRSIVRRISDFMQGISIEEDIYFDGGPAQNKGLRLALEKEIGREVKTFPLPQFTSAIGAALVLKKNIDKKGEAGA